MPCKNPTHTSHPHNTLPWPGLPTYTPPPHTPDPILLHILPCENICLYCPYTTAGSGTYLRTHLKGKCLARFFDEDTPEGRERRERLGGRRVEVATGGVGGGRSHVGRFDYEGGGVEVEGKAPVAKGVAKGGNRGRRKAAVKAERMIGVQYGFSVELPPTKPARPGKKNEKEKKVVVGKKRKQPTTDPAEEEVPRTPKRARTKVESATPSKAVKKARQVVRSPSPSTQLLAPTYLPDSQLVPYQQDGAVQSTVLDTLVSFRLPISSRNGVDEEGEMAYEFTVRRVRMQRVGAPARHVSEIGDLPGSFSLRAGSEMPASPARRGVSEAPGSAPGQVYELAGSFPEPIEEIIGPAASLPSVSRKRDRSASSSPSNSKPSIRSILHPGTPSPSKRRKTTPTKQEPSPPPRPASSSSTSSTSPKPKGGKKKKVTFSTPATSPSLAGSLTGSHTGSLTGSAAPSEVSSMIAERGSPVPVAPVANMGYDGESADGFDVLDPFSGERHEGSGEELDDEERKRIRDVGVRLFEMYFIVWHW
ncbi:hypothetical protein BJ508DRAFT_379871 [Ascobolus immersus RN42]|uniref:Uncharacterized protein n=1 Tax=Ascobolus immersus RN42 TaxID=1160509 RepID=A0A3N4HQX0_ASCIM|nr:hypothetical protein BJ508DRAFT_379871 [Ascobolus immersus RN42]